MELVQKSRRSLKLFSSIDTTAFASALVVLTITVLFAVWISPTHHGQGPDLAKVMHPVRMPGANREDALLVTVTRDGRTYFGVEQISPVDLPAKIQDRLKDHSVEPRVYVVADARARWGTVKVALDGMRSAGILRVGFLMDQRRFPILTR